MPETIAPRRRRYFQFSLRALLALMLFVGVAVAVYRWPWEVSKEQEFETYAFGSYYITDGKPGPGGIGTLVTTYRRDWRGKPVKHGPERFYVQGKLVEEKLFGEGVLHGLARCFNDRGEVLEERTFNNGLQHGPCRIGDGKMWVVSGRYDRGVKDGAWRVLAHRQHGTSEGWFTILDKELHFFTRPSYRLEVPTDPIVIHEEWRGGKRHGNWVWRTLGGELINSARYADDRLTAWNGEDVPEDYWYWLADRDLKLFERLKQPAGNLVQDPLYQSHDPDNYVHRSIDISLFEPDYGRQPLASASECRVVHYALPLSERPFCWPEVSIGDNLLEHALLHGLAPDFRYGALWFVPADEVTGCQDATGVERVNFSKDSQQAREWNMMIPQAPALESRLELLAFREGWEHLQFFDAIAVDVSPVQLVPRSRRQPFYMAHPCQRTRRDAFGLALYRAGFQCEQRGSTILVLPHWIHAKAEAERVAESQFDDPLGGHPSSQPSPRSTGAREPALE